MYKVLLVDDEILAREAISKNIHWQNLGFELLGCCENGEEAIDILNETSIDVVLTDICMPYVDGMDLSKYIYKKFPQISIIIFSGYGEFEYAKQAIQYNVAEYILKPVTAKELSKVLNKIKDKLDSERKDEKKLEEITKGYHNYIKNETLIVSKIISCLVKGTQEVETSIHELEKIGISVNGLIYKVVAVDIDVYSGFCEIDDKVRKESTLMSFVVENIASEIVNNHQVGIAYLDSRNCVSVLFIGKNIKNFTSQVFSICREIKEAVYNAMKLSVSMGIGITVKKLRNLSKSYNSAIEILKYRYTKGCGVIFDCEKSRSKESIKEFEKTLKDIISAVRKKDEELLKDILNHAEERLKSEYITRERVVVYLQRILRVLHETVYETNEKFELKDSEIAAVTEAKSLEAAMRLIRKYAADGMEAVTVAGFSSGKLQAIMAVDYIKENYSDSNLNLNQLCNYLNVSTSRFSSVFKEATGKTFLEVLTDTRMERAKQLLRQTSLRNYEIADKVGFHDPHYFSIAFKKTTGKTPKRYAREI